MSTPDERLRIGAYLGALRRRRWLFAAVFALVLGGWLAHVLVSRPGYRSFARLQIEQAKSTGGVLGELVVLDNALKTEAEVEIMRSRRVARGAADTLEPGAFLVEVNHHRPLEVLLRRLGWGRKAARASVETAPLADGADSEYFTFAFDARGGLSIERSRHESVETRDVPGFRSGEPFEAFGRSFVLRVDGGAGRRRFQLPLRSPHDTARWIQDRVLVREVGRLTGVVSLGVEAESPALARRVAQAVATSYLALKREHKREQARAALSFLKSETARVRKELEAAETDLDEYRAHFDRVLLSQRAEWIVEHASEAQVTIAEKRVVLAGKRRLLGALREENEPSAALAAIDGAELDPMMRTLAARLAELQVEADGLARRGQRPAHPRRKQVEAEIESAWARLRTGLETRLREDVERIEKDIAQLSTTLAGHMQEAAKLPQTERRIAELSRGVRANLRIHDFLVQKEQETHIALESTLANVRLIDTPIAPTLRSRPRLLLQGVIGTLLALLAAVSAAAVAEYLDRSIRSPRDLELATGLPVFGAVPNFRTVRGHRALRRAGALALLDQPDSAVVEAFRIVRTNLRLAGGADQVQTVAITSGIRGEGKTEVACNLGAVCAQHGERVLVVEMDLRWSSMHERLGVKQAPGLADVLSGACDWRDAVQPTRVRGLYVLTAGAKVPNPAALLDAPALDSMLDELVEQYDRILVDAPPVLEASETAALLHRLDGALLVARYRRCSWDALRTVRNRASAVGANVLGTVLNGFDARGAPLHAAYGFGGARSSSRPRRLEADEVEAC